MIDICYISIQETEKEKLNMDLIAIKEIGVELPLEKNIDNCIKYKKTYSVAFARNNIITVVRDLKEDDYEDLIDYYELTKDDAIMFCFQGYAENKLGNMPMVISEKNKKFDQKTFCTNKSVIACVDSILGVEEKEESVNEFLSNLSKFDRNNFSDIANLVFGDNLVAILNADGTFQTYGLELTSTKKWKKSQSGMIYTDEDYNSKTSYNSYYNNNSNYYNSYYGYDDYDYDYDYTDNDPKPYQCDECKEKTSIAIVVNEKTYCGKCYKKNKTVGASK